MTNQGFAVRHSASDANAWHFATPPERADACRVAYCGYVANRSDLLRRFSGVSQEASDAELFVRAYRKWGEDLQAHVLGEYAVAIRDDRNDTTIFTHDALGLRSVFYSHTTEGLVVGSHLQDVLGLTGTGELDEEYIADFLTLTFATGDRTPYRHVRRLLPGRTLVWKTGRLVERRTWDLTQVQPVRLSDDAAYEERFRALLTEGIQAARRCTGKAWCELSGGLDSSTIVCLAAESNPEDLEVLSVVFDRSRSADERKWMRAVLEKYPLPWHTLDGDEESMFSEIPEDFRPEPDLYNVSPARYRRCEDLLSRHGVGALLTGLGGDQVLFGLGAEPFFLADRFWEGGLHRALPGLREWQRKDGARRSLAHWILTRMVAPSLDRLLDRSPTVVPSALPDLAWIRADYARRRHLAARRRRPAFGSGAGIADRWFAEEVEWALFSAHRRAQTIRSYELRCPLLYRPLVEFMFAIPWEQRLRPGETRSLHRRALRGILPEVVRTRRGKSAVDESLSRSFAEHPDWTRFLLDRPRVVSRGYVDDRAWRETIHQMRVGGIPLIVHFFAAVHLELWLRRLETASDRGTNGIQKIA